MSDITPEALKGAAAFAAVGSAFGPIGTGVGAVVGSGVGLFKGLAGRKSEKEQMGLQAPLIAAQTEEIELQNEATKKAVGRQKKIRNLMMGYR